MYTDKENERNNISYTKAQNSMKPINAHSCTTAVITIDKSIVLSLRAIYTIFSLCSPRDDGGPVVDESRASVVVSLHST